MSKKTRKKSPKSPVGSPARGRNTSANNRVSKSRAPSASKSTRNTKKRQSESSARAASHKATSKTLKTVRRTVKATVTRSSANGANAPAPSGSVPLEGSKAPAFRLPRDGGGAVSLSDYAGKKLVVFFYPRADTPGCTKEAMDFTRMAGAFEESGTSLLGVSADPLKAQEAFRDKHRLSVRLASDEQRQMLQAYGAWGEKSMYGRTFYGIIRTTVLIGADGRILRIWRRVRVDGHADEVLAAVRAAPEGKRPSLAEN
jgi:thioredoxin-dependent peroxiredoxin